MASFDFVECSAQSYRFFWENRFVAVRLCALALAVKVLSYVVFIVLGMEKEVLQQGILLMPSYLLEGWVIAHLIVMALRLKEADGPTDKHKFIGADTDMRANIKASMILYGLTMLVLSLVVGSSMNIEQLGEAAASEEPMQTGMLGMIVIMVGIAFSIWSFRLFWLYVPMILGMAPLKFLQVFSDFKVSFHFIGAWLLCFMPMIIVLLIGSQALGGALELIGVVQDTIVYDVVIVIFQASINFVMALVSSVAIAFGVHSVLRGENEKTEIW